jgi:hypothetical protein
MRTQITANPTASVHFKIKLVTDNTHTKITEAISVGAYLTSAIISWDLVLACYVPAPFVNKNLNEGGLREADIGMQESKNPSVNGNKDF